MKGREEKGREGKGVAVSYNRIDILDHEGCTSIESYLVVMRKEFEEH